MQGEFKKAGGLHQHPHRVRHPAVLSFSSGVSSIASNRTQRVWPCIQATFTMTTPHRTVPLKGPSTRSLCLAAPGYSRGWERSLSRPRCRRQTHRAAGSRKAATRLTAPLRRARKRHFLRAGGSQAAQARQGRGVPRALRGGSASPVRLELRLCGWSCACADRAAPACSEAAGSRWPVLSARQAGPRMPFCLT